MSSRPLDRPRKVPSMALLDGLDEVDWGSLHHAYGPATDVPGLLRALVDPASAGLDLRRAAKDKPIFDGATADVGHHPERVRVRGRADGF